MQIDNSAQTATTCDKSLIHQHTPYAYNEPRSNILDDNTISRISEGYSYPCISVADSKLLKMKDNHTLILLITIVSPGCLD